MDIFLSLAVSFIACCLLVIPVYSFVRPIFFGAPFAATTKHSVHAITQILGEAARANGTRRRTVDLGSGDGRIVIALARQGFEAHGFEINPLLVLYSRIKIRKAGLQDHAFIHRKSYWNENMSSYDVVTIFGISYIMRKFEKKLSSELKPGSIVICNHFTFHDWKPEQQIGRLFVYRKVL